jgi:hypothetical protein
MTEQPRDPLLFVVPTLGAAAAQDEEIVQLLLFAAARLDQAPSDRRAVLLSLDRNLTGWTTLAPLFGGATSDRVVVEQLPEPAVRPLADKRHRTAYDFFEYLKGGRYSEVHCLDRGGVAYYASMARRIGLYFGDTAIAVHVVGGTVFGREAGDLLLDDVSVLEDDVLERGARARADAVFVHDRRAGEG